MHGFDDVLTPQRIDTWLGRQMAGENQVERLFRFGLFQEDPHPSEILRTRSDVGHRLGELYEAMLDKDSDLEGIVAKREDAVLQLPRFIEPRDSSPEADEAARLCQYALSKVSGLAINLRHQLGSLGRGVAVEELIWERLARGPYAGAWMPVGMIDRPMWRFAFVKGQLHVRQAQGDPIPAPPGKFLTFRRGSKDTGWGKPAFDRVYWYWFIKHHGWKWFAVHVEKWASPTIVVNYDAIARDFSSGVAGAANATSRENQAKALAAARAIQSEMAVALPKGIELDTFESKRSGNDAYHTFLSLCNRAMALVFLGEINTSGLRPGVGAYASEQVSNEIRYEKVALDGHDLGAHLSDELLRPITEVNFGPDCAVPRFVVDTVEAQDREERRGGIERTLANGLPVPKRYFLQTMQVPVARDGEEVVEREQAAAPPPPAPADQPADPPADPPDPAARARAARARGVVRLAADDAPGAEAAEERQALSEELAAAMAAESLPYWADHQRLAAEAFDQAAADPDFQPMAWLAGQLDPAAAAEHLLAAQAHGIGLALRELLEDGLPTWSLRTGEPAASPLDLPLRGASPRLQGGAGLPPGWADHLTWTAAADFWSNLLNIPKGVFASLEDVNRRFAFTVAGVENTALLRELNDLTREALTQGIGREEYRRRLADLYERRGLTPTSRWHSDLVYQNNLSQAQGAVRYAQTVGNPAAHALFPYIVFHTLGDEKVRARERHNHRLMNGLGFAIQHAIWRTWWYPAGHNCRCYVATVTRAEAQRLGWLGAEPTGPWPIAPETGERALPDPGFRSAPILSTTTAEAIEPALERHVAAAERELAGTPAWADLLAAFRLLFEALGLGDLLGGR